jgi:predicted ATP-grasp superfamily ATP-dependent carboligase
MNLVIVGASARAAAFSALRAGLHPWCADLFVDVDLRQRCPGIIIPTKVYPEKIANFLLRAPQCPWMYTGALENSPQLVERIAQTRPLWGNHRNTLRLVRDPIFVSRILAEAGLPAPKVRPAGGSAPCGGRWLLKPRASAAGVGIRFWVRQPLSRQAAKRYYLQEWIEGESGAALFLGQPGGVQLLGVTRQLVSESLLHVASFHYCGSIGPYPLPAGARSTLERIGQTLATATGLRGLFGIDFVLRDGVPWAVEVNPRYTASVEVLEYALGLSAIDLHRDIFDTSPERKRRGFRAPVARAPGWYDIVVGKAILYAESTLMFPQDGPWMESLQQARPIEEMPAYADIPDAGQVIEKGRPVLSFFTRATDEARCLENLRRIAIDLDRRLAGG